MNYQFPIINYQFKKIVNRSKGFTLIELIIAVAITVIAGGLILSIFVKNGQIFHDQQNKVTQGLSLADSLKKINDLVRLSSGVAANYTNGSTTYTSGLTSLVLQLPGLDATGTNLPNIYDYCVISVDPSNNNILRLQTFPNASSTRPSQNSVLSSNLFKVNFFYYDNMGATVSPISAQRINITLNTREPSALNTKASSASSDINLRND